MSALSGERGEGGDAGEAFFQALVGEGEGEADVAFAAGAVAVARRDDDSRVVKEAFGEGGGRHAFRYLRPDVETGFRWRNAEAELVQSIDRAVAAALVDRVVVGDAVLRAFEGGDGHALDGL